MGDDMFVQAFDDGEAAGMPSPAFDVFRPHVDRQEPERHFWHMRTPDGGEAEIYADVTPETFEDLTISRFSAGDPLDLLESDGSYSPTKAASLRSLEDPELLATALQADTKNAMYVYPVRIHWKMEIIEWRNCWHVLRIRVARVLPMKAKSL
jgi:hypothetical protein